MHTIPLESPVRLVRLSEPSCQAIERESWAELFAETGGAELLAPWPVMGDDRSRLDSANSAGVDAGNDEGLRAAMLYALLRDFRPVESQALRGNGVIETLGTIALSFAAGSVAWLATNFVGKPIVTMYELRSKAQPAML